MKRTIAGILGALLMLLCITSCTNEGSATKTEQPAATGEATQAPEETVKNTDPIKVGSISGILGPVDAMVCCKAVQVYFD